MPSMQRIVVFLIIVVALSAIAVPVRAELAEEAKLCRDESVHPDVRVGACTYLIRWGDHSDETLAAAFHARGLAYDALGEPTSALSDYSNPPQAGRRGELHQPGQRLCGAGRIR